MGKLKAPEILVPAMATLLAAVAALLLVRNAFTVMVGDAVAYWDMAQEPIDLDRAWWWGNVPYTYRIAIPFLVRNLFGSSLGGFIFLAVLSLLVSNYLVFGISRLYTRSTLVPSMVTLVFATNFTIFNPLVNPALVDLPSFVCLLMLAYLYLRSIASSAPTHIATWLAYAAVLLVAALIKEWIFFVLPVLFIHLVSTRMWKKAAMIFLFSLPAVAAHAVIRVIMGPFLPEIQSPGLALLLERYFTEVGAYRSIFATFGAIWLVLPVALLYCYRKVKPMKETYIPAVLAFVVFLFMGTIASDHNRYLFFISFPFLIPALSLYFSRYNKNLKKGAVYGLAALFLLARLAMHYRPAWQEGFDLVGSQSGSAVLAVSVAAIVQIAVVVYYLAGASGRVPLPGFLADKSSQTP